MTTTKPSVVRRAVLAAFLLPILSPQIACADWGKFEGTYVGTWKSFDTDGKSYSGPATIKIKGGKGNSLKLSLQTSFLGNPIIGQAKSKADGKLAVVVSNAILGTVSGTGKAKAGGTQGSLKGAAALYGGTATLNSKLKAVKNGLKAKGTLLRALPFLPPATLTFSFSGKKK